MGWFTRGCGLDKVSIRKIGRHTSHDRPRRYILASRTSGAYTWVVQVFQHGEQRRCFEWHFLYSLLRIGAMAWIGWLTFPKTDQESNKDRFSTFLSPFVSFSYLPPPPLSTLVFLLPFLHYPVQCVTCIQTHTHTSVADCRICSRFPSLRGLRETERWDIELLVTPNVRQSSSQELGCFAFGLALRGQKTLPSLLLSGDRPASLRVVGGCVREDPYISSTLVVIIIDFIVE